MINTPSKVVAIDIRGNLDFNRIHVEGSINIPFSSVLLGDARLESLNISNLDAKISGRVVVIIGNVHENAILVYFMITYYYYYVKIFFMGFYFTVLKVFG